MIYLDDAMIQSKGKSWCHMVSDISVEELHTFAQHIGLKRHWYQAKSWPHYDVSGIILVKAIKLINDTGSNGIKRCAYMDVLHHNFAWIERSKG